MIFIKIEVYQLPAILLDRVITLLTINFHHTRNHYSLNDKALLKLVYTALANAKKTFTNSCWDSVNQNKFYFSTIYILFYLIYYYYYNVYCYYFKLNICDY